MSVSYPGLGACQRGIGALLRLSSDDDPQQGLHHGGFHVVGGGDFPHRVRDLTVLALVRRVLAEARSAAHPHIHHDGIHVSGDGTGECVRLQTAQTVETVRDATVGSGHMGTQALRRDTLRVLEGLGLIVAPSNTGRECRHDASGDFQRPRRVRTQRLREGPSLGVPSLGSVQVEDGDGGEQGAEVVRSGGGGEHDGMIPRSAAMSTG